MPWKKRWQTKWGPGWGLGFLLGLTAATPGLRPQTVIDFQKHRTEQSRRTPDRHVVTLTNLNPTVNRWYVLTVQNPDGSRASFHLENNSPQLQQLELNDENPYEVQIITDQEAVPCALWSKQGPTGVMQAAKVKRPYVDLCGGRLYLRNSIAGHRTKKEWATDLLRDRVRYGDQITNFVKERFFRDRFLRKSDGKIRSTKRAPADHNGPAVMLLSDDSENVSLSPRELNLVIPRDRDGRVDAGRWYGLEGYEGIYVATAAAHLISAEIVERQKSLVNPLDDVESTALVYLVAFDLDLFELGFALGTDHPRVGWSERVPEGVRTIGLPGPDGFDSIHPLVRTGKLSPLDVERAAATFSGGFKRSHGAFKWGDMAQRNNGTHYGFVESGIVLSSLQPGLATLIVRKDGRVEMRTWSQNSETFVADIVHARQNGVPILEPDPRTGDVRPGSLVREWGQGNWSGSQDKKFRSLRAGACIQEKGEKRYLIYGYFSSVTPSAMARVFEACQCQYAMHLDMNAPEHTYLAVYRVVDSQFVVQRLVKEMAEVDGTVDGQEVPRYLGYSDNRDFFYLLKKE